MEDLVEPTTPAEAELVRSVQALRNQYLERFGGQDPTVSEHFFELPDLRQALKEIRDPTTPMDAPLSKRIKGVQFTATEYAYLYVLYNKNKRAEKCAAKVGGANVAARGGSLVSGDMGGSD